MGNNSIQYRQTFYYQIFEKEEKRTQDLVFRAFYCKIDGTKYICNLDHLSAQIIKQFFLKRTTFLHKNIMLNFFICKT